MISTLEQLEQQAIDNNVYLLSAPLPDQIKGLLFASLEFTTITLNSTLITSPQRATVLAEELGHFHTTPIDLFTAPEHLQRQYELRAAVWAANEVAPLSSIVQAWQTGVRSHWELAEYLGVTEEFIVRALELHSARCGLSTRVGEYLITFDLLHIEEVS